MAGLLPSPVNESISAHRLAKEKTSEPGPHQDLYSLFCDLIAPILRELTAWNKFLNTLVPERKDSGESILLARF